MTPVVVGMADGRVSREPGQVLATYALGSCIAIAIHDPVARIGGLVHFMLPDSAVDVEKSRRNPWMFADTAIPLLFRQAYEMGADKRRLVVSAAGGANVMNDGGLFQIGKRNGLAMRKILWRSGILLHKEWVGGTECRSVYLEVGTGVLRVRTAGAILPPQ